MAVSPPRSLATNQQLTLEKSDSLRTKVAVQALMGLLEGKLKPAILNNAKTQCSFQYYL